MNCTADMPKAQMIEQTAIDLDLQAAGIWSAVKLREKHPELRRPIIEGLLRQGETMNVIGASKAGKSWMVTGLAIAIANGLPWLGREITPGRVLLVDNELHPETLIDRLGKVAEAGRCEVTGREPTIEQVDVMPLRGVAERSDIVGLVQRLSGSRIEGRYRLICIDALYRAIPAGTSESDNAQMMQVYNQIDRLARLTGAAVVLNHHATKGDQSGKSVTDVGSGAGAISRAADAHLTIRPHEDPELCVLDAVTRSFAPPESRSVRFDWPRWRMSLEEPKLRQLRSGQDDRQAARDAEGREAVLDAIGTDGAFIGGIRSRTGYSPGRVAKLLAQLRRDGAVRCEARPCKHAPGGESLLYFPA